MNADFYNVAQGRIPYPLDLAVAMLRTSLNARSTRWRSFIIHGAIVSYRDFHFNARHSRAQYQDGKGR